MTTLPEQIAPQAAQLYQDGHTYRQIAAQLHCDYGTARTAAITGGAPPRTARRIPEPTATPEDLDQARTLYLEHGYTAAEIGAVQGVSEVTGKRRLRLAGVTMRPKSQALRLASARKRGEPLTRDLLIPDTQPTGGKIAGETYLPARPFVEWFVCHPLSKEALLDNAEVYTGGHVGAILRGDTKTIGLTLADRILTANDTRLDDVWPDLDTHLKDAA